MQYGTKCSCCQRAIQTTDWVRRAKNYVYHLACFACDVCKRQLSTGEEFALVDNKVLCKLHYIERLDSPVSGSSSAEQVSPDGELEEEEKSKLKLQHNRAKRVRTSFTEDQLQILQANFDIDANPDSAELERIASQTGLSKRVTQVWFQNSRARQKKQGSIARLPSSGACSMCGLSMCSCSQSSNASG